MPERRRSGTSRMRKDAADWLSLAAAPTFALMALLVALAGGSHDLSSLNGMALMYLLMSAFHSAPWLRLISRRSAAPLS